VSGDRWYAAQPVIEKVMNNAAPTKSGSRVALLAWSPSAAGSEGLLRRMMPTWPTHKIVCMLKSSALLQHPSSSPDTMRIAAHTWNNATVKAPVVTTSGAL